MIVAYRVQGPDGRGPWRPGWSHTWIDAEAPPDRLTETIMDLIPAYELRRLPPGMAYGCACKTLADLMRWFTPHEKGLLKTYGFHPVRLVADVILASSEWQMLIGRTRPFSEGATRVSWR